MRDAVAVAEEERGDELGEVAPRQGLREAAAQGELGKELAATGVVDDEVDFGLCGEDLVDFEDVWVVLEAAHGIDLAHDAGLHGGVDRLELVDGLDGQRGAVYEGACLVHFGEVAAAKEARELVPAEDGAWWRRRFHRCGNESPRQPTVTDCASLYIQFFSFSSFPFCPCLFIKITKPNSN